MVFNIKENASNGPSPPPTAPAVISVAISRAMALRSSRKKIRSQFARPASPPPSPLNDANVVAKVKTRGGNERVFDRVLLERNGEASRGGGWWLVTSEQFDANEFSRHC